MIRGEFIYRDFFECVTPGTTLLYLLLFKVFGLRAWIPNALLVAMGTLMTYIVLAISKKVISGWVAYLPALMFPTLAMRAGLDGTHHWYSSLCSMAAILVVTEKRNPTRLLFAGALCGG